MGDAGGGVCVGPRAAFRERSAYAFRQLSRVTRYLLDTDALIDFSKGAEPATSLILSWIDGTDEVAVCAITIGEFFAGLTREQASTWESFVMALTYWDITRHASMRAGQDRYALDRVGKHITMTDALLAGVARENSATLVTGNARHYPTGDVTLLSLREAR
jgi:predicted nucleic acid-binding protein